jgi:hypothetical protein
VDLDNADQRFYASTYGRFNTPDRRGGRLSNPGSLNRYAYVLGDPVNHNDPRGLCSVFIGGFGSYYDPNSAFTQIGGAAGAVQAYPYAGCWSLGSLPVGSFFNWFAQAATQTALSAILSALQNNSGTVDIVAWSGGAQAFTNAYNDLSPAQQQRIGDIVYVSPGAFGTLASNSSTTILIGAGGQDVFATGLTTIPATVDTTCNHRNFACFVQQAQAQFSPIQNDGSCSSPQTFSNPAYTAAVALQQQAQQMQLAASWSQVFGDTVSGLAGSFLDWVDSIPIGGYDPGYEVDETITYP